MAWWFVRGLRRGVVTTRYPARPDPVAATFPSPPAFRPELLTEDTVDAAVRACPAGALDREGAMLRYDVGRCTACGACLAAVGAAAVPSGQFELAATDRDHLVKTIPILGRRREE